MKNPEYEESCKYGTPSCCCSGDHSIIFGVCDYCHREATQKLFGLFCCVCAHECKDHQAFNRLFGTRENVVNLNIPIDKVIGEFAEDDISSRIVCGIEGDITVVFDSNYLYDITFDNGRGGGSVSRMIVKRHDGGVTLTELFDYEKS